MASAGTINIGLNLVTGRFKKSAKRVMGDLKGLAKSLNPISIGFNMLEGAIGLVTGAFGDMIAPFTSVSGFMSAMRQEFENLDAMAKFADSVGFTVDEMRGFSLAAEMSGVASNKFEASMMRMTRMLGDAQAGAAQATRAFDMLGVDPSTFTSTGDAFKQIAEKIATTDDAATKASMAYQIFGRSGIELIPMLNEGAEGLDEFIAKAEELGGPLNRLDIANVEAMNDAWTEVQKSFDGIVTQIAISLVPYMKAIADAFLATGVNGSMAANVIIGAWRFVGEAIAIAADIVDLLWLGFKAGQYIVTRVVQAILQHFAILAKGVQYVINLLPGVETTFGDTLQTMTDDVGKAADKIADDIVDGLAAPSNSEKVRKFFSDVERGAKDAANAINNGPAKLSEAVQKANEEALNYVGSLQKQIDTFGMSTEAAKLYELQQKGVSQEIIKVAEALNTQLDSLKEAEKAQKEAADIVKSNLTPLENYRDSLSRIQALVEAGALSEAEAAKQRQKLWQGLTKDITGAVPAVDAYKAKIAELKTLMDEGIITFQQAKAAAIDAIPDNIKDLVTLDASPLEDFQNKVSELQQFLDAGAISAEDFANGLKNAIPQEVLNIIEGTKTPFEKVAEEIERIQELQRQGFLDDATAEKAVANALAGLPQRGQSLPFASAVEMGSQEARQAILRHRFDSTNDPMEKLLKVQEEASKSQKRTIPLLEEIAKKTGKEITVRF